MKFAEAGIAELQKCVDTQIIIPNQNLFRVANEKTTFADAFAMADQVLYSGVACITDLMVKEGLINLDFADVRAIMREMGKAMMGTGEASGEKRALRSAEAAIANPLIDDVSMKGARGLLISITGGKDLTLYEVDEAATRIREEVDQDANIIVGATFDEGLEGIIRVSVVATGIDHVATAARPAETRAGRSSSARCGWTPSASRRALASQPQATAPAPVQPLARPSVQQVAHRGGGRGAGDVSGGDGRRHRPSDHAQAVLVRRAGDGRAGARRTCPRRSSRRSPSGSAAARACRGIEELPIPAQNEIRASRGEVADAGPEKQRMTLLQRLAQVGLGRRDDGPTHERDARQHGAIAAACRNARRSRRCRSGVGIRQTAAGSRRRRASISTAGQALPVQKPVDDDQLEIPAFLRRQAN